MRASLHPTGPTEAVVIVTLDDGRRLTLPMQLIADAPAGLWKAGRLEALTPAPEALRLAAATRQDDLSSALRS